MENRMILGIETATEVCSAALIYEQKILSSRSVNEKNVHSERLMILVNEVLQKSQKNKNDISAIAVSIGPGSFTGLRIGLSVAKGLAFALNIPIIAVPSLDGIAEEYRRTRNKKTDEIFCAMIDAKRSEAFYSFYKISADDIEVQTEYSIKLRDEICADAISQNAVFQQPLCNAISIGFLAERYVNKYIINDFSQLEPLYVRDFVTTAPKQQ
jgi:tRNA threonylcarbamoyladenosine biosynthesis protein TsaB